MKNTIAAIALAATSLTLLVAQLLMAQPIQAALMAWPRLATPMKLLIVALTLRPTCFTSLATRNLVH